MAYDDGLAARISDVLAGEPGLIEKKMFGGLAFIIDGNLCCGVVGITLMVRIDRDSYEEALTEPHTRPMDFTGRPMRGLIYVDPEGVAEDPELRAWVERGVRYARSLPAK